MNDDLTQAIQRTGASVGEKLDAVFDSLETLRHEASSLLEVPQPTHFSLASLEPVVASIISEHDGLVLGAGLAVAPGALADTAAWMQSWHRRGEALSFTRHSLNPSSMSYYDYTNMEWFQAPVATEQAALTGPYMDFGGTDTLIVTASTPVRSQHGTVSVLAADLSLSRIETLFLHALGEQGSEVALLTGKGRVVATNSARLAVEAVAADHVVAVADIPMTPMAKPWSIAIRS